MVPWVSWSNFPSSAWFVVLQQFFLLSVKCSLTPGHHLVLMVLVINVTSENNPIASQAPLTTADQSQLLSADPEQQGWLYHCEDEVLCETEAPGLPLNHSCFKSIFHTATTQLLLALFLETWSCSIWGTESNSFQGTERAALRRSSGRNLYFWFINNPQT